MKDFTEQINQYISGKMNPERIPEFENSLAENEGLREQYRILLNAREYIKAKVVLEDMESDPDLPGIMDQVIDHYEGNNEFRLDARNHARLGIVLIPVALLALHALIKIIISLQQILK